MLASLGWLLIPSLESVDLLHMRQPDKQEVEHYWSSHPNLIYSADSPVGTAPFFEEIDRERKRTHWPLYELVPFHQTRDRDVLEIGCGLGTDTVEFARAGARYTGIDLTAPAVALTAAKLRAYGLPGRTLKADAEHLPFDDASFDIVYSWGVIHHTPDTVRCVDEIYRVLRPGGTLILMLYHLHGWWELRIRAHWRLLALLRFRPFAWGAVRLGADAGQVARFRAMYRANRTLLYERFVARETDGGAAQANPHSKLYSRSDVRRLLSAFEHVRLQAAHWMDVPRLERWLGAERYRRILRRLGALNGSCLHAFARKPCQQPDIVVHTRPARLKDPARVTTEPEPAESDADAAG
jgi:SAM-dependent methyltransferase